MSTELAVAAERGQSMGELMGFSSNPSKQTTPSIARIGMQHQPIMGEVEFNGKMIKTEVVPVGAFTLTQGDSVVYSTGITVRIFYQRSQWQRWNGDTNEMEKTVMAQSLYGDLKDSVGGFNLGRRSGYIEDFNALSETEKAVIRSVKRVKVFYGTVTLDNPIDASGNTVSGDYVDIPFVMDVKNRDSLKSIDTVLKKIDAQRVLPYMTTIKFKGVEDSIPTGAKFGKIEASLGDRLDLTDDDERLTRNFLELIEYSNGKILDLHNERNDDALSTEDASMVKDIIDNDFVDVDE
jgi:hypothetical protein